MAFQLRTSPLKLNELPTDEAAIAAAKELLATTTTWKQGKIYGKHAVQTSWRGADGPNELPWHCRVSEHNKEEATFDIMWDKLGPNGPSFEPEYNPGLSKNTLIKRISQTQEIWSMYFTLPPPLSSRVFTILRVAHLDQHSSRTGYIIQIPVDLSEDKELAALEERGVHGRFLSVERFLQLENGNTEWKMAVSSTPGGNIPTFFADMSMPSQIASDVSNFMTWLQKAASKSSDASEPKEANASCN